MPMIVLDCSAAMEIVLATPRGKGFVGMICDGEKIVASELFLIEIRSALWKYVCAGHMSDKEAEWLAERALELVDEFIPMRENVDEAFREACRQRHPVYDMLYLTLARRYAATLMSSDRKLANLCERMGVDCVVEVES